jgi:amino acid transporter
LREAFSKYSWGRLVAFLFIWQFLITAALETASGYVGAAGFLKFLFPGLATRWLGGWFTGENYLAAAVATLVALALCRDIRSLGWLAVILCTGTIVTVSTVILAGLWHFDRQVLGLSDVKIQYNAALVLGLAASMRVAIYDYLGYYNVCHLGDEVRDPAKTIPRAVLISVVVVAAIYLTMNIAIIGVIPWREAMVSTNVVADFMTRLFGKHVAALYTVLIIWTALAGLFAMTLGYSRIPYAAARNGDFFRVFGKLHPTGHYPRVSLLFFGALVVASCFLKLSVLVEAAVTIRIPMQFISQIVALHVVRKTRPDVKLPFRMWLYPLPALVALLGWVFLLVTSDTRHLQVVCAVLVSGCLAFWCWAIWQRGDRVTRDGQ